MPPKVKITKEDIVNTAVDVVRREGVQGINARNIAGVLNCSTQPIFSNFATMDELKTAVLVKTEELYNQYIHREIAEKKYPAYKASGMAYIRFAKEEKELFKLLYMRDRTDEAADQAVGFGEEMESIVQDSTGLDKDNAALFHMEMWAYVHGIATMFATGYLDICWDLVSRMLTDAYKGMRKQYGME